MSREQLAQKLYSRGDEVASNAIEVHIHHLRRKLQSNVIQTVRWPAEQAGEALRMSGTEARAHS